jgi:hypothetical protein
VALPLNVKDPLYFMSSMHLYMVHKKFEGYSNSLDKKRQEVFDCLVFEVAGMREETLVMHPDHTEAMMMNILIEMEMRLQKLENKLQGRCRYLNTARPRRMKCSSADILLHLDIKHRNGQVKRKFSDLSILFFLEQKQAFV